MADVPGENTLPARLEIAMFLGERWEHLFHAGELRIRVWADRAPAQRPSFLLFPPETLVVL